MKIKSYLKLYPYPNSSDCDDNFGLLLVTSDNKGVAQKGIVHFGSKMGAWEPARMRKNDGTFHYCGLQHVIKIGEDNISTRNWHKIV